MLKWRAILGVKKRVGNVRSRLINIKKDFLQEETCSPMAYSIHGHICHI